MTANQYKTLIAKLGLLQTEAGPLLNCTDRTSRRWARDGVTGTARILWRLLASGKVTIEDIEEARL